MSSRRLRGWAGLVLFALLLALAPAAPARALPVTADDETGQIARTVLELSRLQQRGNGNELYDWLSDATRQRLPRADFVTWLATDEAFRPTADPEIRSISRGPWVWPVTGVRYPDVATVQVVQAGVRDGIPTQSLATLRLAFDGAAHRWRWLFGEDRAHLAGIAAAPAPVSSFASAFTAEPYARIDRFWARIFSGSDRPYQPVLNVVAVETTPLVTGCGTETDINAAGIYTCLLDETIYYSPGLRQDIVGRFGEIGWEAVIAHEWAHQVQVQFGIAYGLAPELDGGYYILELETQADCLTGIYMQDLAGRGLVTSADLQTVRRVLGAYGDFGTVAWDATNAHGSGADRVAAFANGYHNGFVGCGLDLDTPA